MIKRLRCLFLGYHDPVRYPVGGFRCRLCGQAGASLDEMGFDGFVSPLRRIYSRENNSVERRYGW